MAKSNFENIYKNYELTIYAKADNNAHSYVSLTDLTISIKAEDRISVKVNSDANFLLLLKDEDEEGKPEMIVELSFEELGLLAGFSLTKQSRQGLTETYGQAILFAEKIYNDENLCVGLLEDTLYAYSQKTPHITKVAISL